MSRIFPASQNDLWRAGNQSENLARHIYSLLFSVGDFTDVISLKTTKQGKNIQMVKTRLGFVTKVYRIVISSPPFLFKIEHRLSSRWIHHLADDYSFIESQSSSGFVLLWRRILLFKSSHHFTLTESGRSSMLTALARTPGCSTISTSNGHLKRK